MKPPTAPSRQMSANAPVPRKPRLETKATVLLRSGAGENYGVIANLHDDGAMVETEPNVDQGDVVSLVVAGAEVYAQVAWRTENQIGLSFYSPIPVEIVEQLHREIDARLKF